MSGGYQHPQATLPFLEGDTIALDSTTFGKHLLIHGLSSEHTLWNWKTGEQIVVRHQFDVQRILLPDAPLPPERTDTLPPGTWDFAFISPRAFMLATVDGPGSIELFMFEATSSSEGPVHVASLRLPELQQGQELTSITTHSAPFLAHPIRGS